MSSKSVIVIGGGLAGLSSAVALAEAGFRVRLFEQRPFLGGRASSYILPGGERVDNCQHVTLGCCTNLDDFYRRVGAADKIAFYDALTFVDALGRRSVMQASSLPAPLHLAGSLALFSALGLRDRLSVAEALMAIARRGGRNRPFAPPSPEIAARLAEERANLASVAAGAGNGKQKKSRVIGFTVPPPSMLDWLRGEGQSEAALARFWGVILVSALNEELARTDVRYGLDVFWKAFLANRAGYRIGLPTVPLSELYGGCRDAIESRGGDVVLRATVRSLHLNSDRITGVEVETATDPRRGIPYRLPNPGDRDFEAIESEPQIERRRSVESERRRAVQIERADFYLLAVPHHAALHLLPPAVFDTGGEPGGQAGGLPDFRRLQTSPITGVHFWFDRDVMGEPFLTLLDRTTQWIFNKSLLYGGPGFGSYVQLVISASRSLLPLSRQEIIDLCLRELRQVLPDARGARLLNAAVIKEANATFSPEPGADRWRPRQRTPFSNLFLAGDWTATGWPATMEGAVRSGYLAAEAILEDAGSVTALVRPDLPVEGFARLWA